MINLATSLLEGIIITALLTSPPAQHWAMDVWVEVLGTWVERAVELGWDDNPRRRDWGN